jgi:hypothetical protein
MKKRIFFVVVAFILSSGWVSQGIRAQEKPAAKADSISLLDVKKVSDYLGLSEAQLDSVKGRIEQIQSIIDEDKKAREEMRAKFMSGEGGFNRESMQAMRAERDGRQKKIDALVEEIKKNLKDDQKTKFGNVLIPNLQEIARAEREQWRGGGRRGGNDR